MSENGNAPSSQPPEGDSEGVEAPRQAEPPGGEPVAADAPEPDVTAPEVVGDPAASGDASELVEAVAPGTGSDPSPAAAAASDGPRTVVAGRLDFATSLESFQGPLDLLLYLIKEDEVEITNIPIARVLEQYVKFLDAAQSVDLHLAGEFLVMATTLMEIKSRELLPVKEALEGVTT